MRRIRSLAIAKLKTVNKEVKIRTPRRHIRKGHRHEPIANKCHTWCGTYIGTVYQGLEKGDTVMDESDYLISLRSLKDVEFCSCCDNAITRAIRQRMLGI